MNPFKPDPEKKLAHDLDAARASRDALVIRLKAAELAVTERRTAAQRLARDGADDAMLDAAEADLRRAQDRVATLTAALGEIEQQVTEFECARDDLAGKKLRAETAAAIEKLAQELAQAAAAFDTGSSQLAETCNRIAPIVLDCYGLQAFAMNARAEVPAAVKMITGILKDRARATLDGNAPATLPKPAPDVAPEQMVPPPKIVTVFFLRATKWKDSEGKTRLIPKFSDGELPPAVAARALAVGAAVAVTDERRKKYGSQSLPPPNEEWCFNLDDATEPSREPVQHSAFEVVDRGKPYALKVARGTPS